MSSAWKPLPPGLSSPARQLVEQLRAVKDGQGLSLADLAARTHYSKASWHRWLHGERLITTQALAAMTSRIGGDARELADLLEAARAASTAGAGPCAQGAAPVGADPAAEVGAPAEALAPAGSLRGDPPPAAAGTHSAALREEPPVAAGHAAATGPSEGARGGDAAPRAERVGEAGGSAIGAPPPALPGERRPARLLSWHSAATGGLGLVIGLAAGFWGHSVIPTQAQPRTSARLSAAERGPAPSCQGVGCAHKDPQQAGCNGDAFTARTATIGKVIVYLRYSPRCEAAWAKITDGAPGDRAVITTSAGEQETALIHWGYDNYSRMVDVSGPAISYQVCGVQPRGSACTALVTGPATAPPPAALTTARTTATAAGTALPGR